MFLTRIMGISFDSSRAAYELTHIEFLNAERVIKGAMDNPLRDFPSPTVYVSESQEDGESCCRQIVCQYLNSRLTNFNPRYFYFTVTQFDAADKFRLSDLNRENPTNIHCLYAAPNV